MQSIEEIRRKMVESGLNTKVGGGVPKVIGDDNIVLLNKFTSFEPDMKILDFGCGCGRVVLPMLEKLGTNCEIVGLDVIPDMIDFCRNEITPTYPNTSFYQLDARNDHYNHFIDGTEASKQLISEISDLPHDEFDLIFAFSVFTHLDQADTIKYLNELASKLRIGGQLIISTLLINESSLRNMKDGTSGLIFDKDLVEDEDLYYSNPKDLLACVGAEENTYLGWAKDAGLEIGEIYYGHWSGKINRSCFQDVLSFFKPSRLPEGFDPVFYVSIHEDLPYDTTTEEGLKLAKEHYLRWGVFEGRKWQ